MLRKKILISLISTVTLLILINIPTYASTGKITGETVKLRKSASLDSGIETLLSINDKIEVISKDGDWYKVKYKDYTGYVYKDYVKVDGEVAETENKDVKTENTNSKDNSSQEITEEETTDKIEIKTLSEDANVYIIPLINSSITSSLEKDKNVTVLEKINGWVYIVSSDIYGWMREDKLTDINSEKMTETSETKAEVKKEETKTATEENKQETKIKYISSTTVNLRKEASKTSELVAKLSLNTSVEVLSTEGNWSKVKVNGKEGYILSELLSDKKQEVTNRSLESERIITENAVKKEESNKTVQTVTAETTTKAASTKTSSSTSATGSNIVDYAKKYLGTKYVSGGSSPNGFDCSGFTSYVYKNFGYNLARSTGGQASAGSEVAKSNLQVGDIVVFNNNSNTSIGHVGIYIGDNNFIHASNPSSGVKITSLSDSYYQKRYVTARRVIN